MDVGDFDIDLDDNFDLEVLNFIEFGIPRQLYIRQNYFDEFDEIGFRKRFRLSRESALHVLELIEDHLEFPYDSNNCVPPMNQLLTCLRFYSTGGHLQLVPDFMGMHLSTVSRIIVRVSEAIAGMYDQFISFPNTEDRIRKQQQDFFDISSFPRVIGAIDCTHVPIQSPGGVDGEIFRNRKGNFSINTQMICDARLKIINVVARWPGSSHDATIFCHSQIRQDFENKVYRNCLLLGDSGYPNKTYMFTPLLNPTTPREQLYNESHIRTRNTIERCFGNLKRRFPVLAYGCRLKLQTTFTIILATSILHNIAKNMGDNEPPPVPQELDEHELNQLIVDGQVPVIFNQQNAPVGAGPGLRAQFINNYFSQL